MGKWDDLTVNPKKMLSMEEMKHEKLTEMNQQKIPGHEMCRGKIYHFRGLSR